MYAYRQPETVKDRQGGQHGFPHDTILRDSADFIRKAVDGIVGKMTWSKLYDLTEVKAATPSQTPKWIGSIVPPPLMVRTDPDPDADMLSTYPYLGYGNLVDVCDELTGKDGKRWYFVRIAGKHFGYVPGDCVETVN